MVKNLPAMQDTACNEGDVGSIPGPERSLREGNGIQLQYFCLENPLDWEPWQITVHGVTRISHELVTKPPYIYIYTYTHLYLYIYVLCCASSLSHVPLFSSPWTVATQASLSMGILQTRILEWVTIPSSRASSQPRDQTQVYFTAAELITTEGKPYLYLYIIKYYSAMKRMKYCHLQ